MSSNVLSPAFDTVEMRQFVFSDGKTVHDVMVERFSDDRIAITIEADNPEEATWHSMVLPLDPRYARLIGCALLDLAQAPAPKGGA